MRAANLSSDTVTLTLHSGTTIGKSYPLSEQSEITTEGAEYYEIPQSNKHQVNQVTMEWLAAELHTGSDLVHEFSDVFSTGKQDLGQADWLYHSFYTRNQAPIKQVPSQLPIQYKQEVGQMLDEMQQQLTIEPSHSP